MFGAITSKNKTLKCQSKDWLPHHCTQTFYFGIIDLDQYGIRSRTNYIWSNFSFRELGSDIDN